MRHSPNLHPRQNGADRPCQNQPDPQPLTTIFTPPASCKERFTPYSSYQATLVQKIDDVDCIPQDVQCAFYFGLHYNPGRCPSGYTTFASSVDGDATVATCCSSGFYHTSISPSDPNLSGANLPTPQCLSSITNRQTRTLTWDTTSTWTVTSTVLSSTNEVVMSSIQPTVATTVLTFGAMIMPPLYITARREDFPVTSSVSVPSKASSSSSALSTSASSPPPDSQPGTPNKSGTSLSTGAKAGIGVGITAVVIIACVCAVLLWRRRKRKEGGDGGAESVPEWRKPEERGEERGMSELQGGKGALPHELEGRGRVGELP